MARTTANAQAQETTQAQDIQAMQRANRVAVSATEGGFVAEFWRTHKRVTTIASAQTGWVANPQQNRSAQREDFRSWICENAADIGVLWSPEDKRADENKRLATYPTDEDLSKDTISLVAADISGFVESSPFEVSIADIVVDGITPTSTTAKGTILGEKMGIGEGRYLKNGNWAWATISICATLKMGDTEIYVSTEASLVSGQLKKPGKVGDGGWTQTAWTTAIRKELEIAGLIKKEEEGK